MPVFTGTSVRGFQFICAIAPPENSVNLVLNIPIGVLRLGRGTAEIYFDDGGRKLTCLRKSFLDHGVVFIRPIDGTLTGFRLGVWWTIPLIPWTATTYVA